jgi:hypothetical protein
MDCQLTANLEDLERRIQILEDIEAIRRLKARYADACDRGYDADTIASPFAEDAVWDAGTFGRYEGREARRGVGEAAVRAGGVAIRRNAARLRLPLGAKDPKLPQRKPRERG